MDRWMRRVAVWLVVMVLAVVANMAWQGSRSEAVAQDSSYSIDDVMLRLATLEDKIDAIGSQVGVDSPFPIGVDEVRHLEELQSRIEDIAGAVGADIILGDVGYVALSIQRDVHAICKKTKSDCSLQ